MVTITLHGRIGNSRTMESARHSRYMMELRGYVEQLERMGDAEAAAQASLAVWDVVLDADMQRKARTQAIRTVKTPSLPTGGDDDDCGFDESTFDRRWKELS